MGDLLMPPTAPEVRSRERRSIQVLEAAAIQQVPLSHARVTGAALA
jgi:hypothetical protein